MKSPSSSDIEEIVALAVSGLSTPTLVAGAIRTAYALGRYDGVRDLICKQAEALKGLPAAMPKLPELNS